MAKERVKSRVREGGHNIPENTIERRYYSGIRNLFDLYFPVCDTVILIDNCDKTLKFVMKTESGQTEIYDNNTLQEIKSVLK
jgi:predicted ABC-type ATPase